MNLILKRKYFFTLIISLINLTWTSAQGILWEKNYGGTEQFDEIYTLINHNNTAYILSGTTNSTNYDFDNSNHGNQDACLIKVDLIGNKIWSKTYGSSKEDAFLCSKTDPFGNIYSVGVSSESNGDVSIDYGNMDVWVVKTDSSGNIIWEKSYGGSNDEVGYDFVFAPDGSLMVACVTSSHDDLVTDHFAGANRDIWLLRLDSSNGSIIWKKCYGGSGDDGYGNYTPPQIRKGVSIATQNDSLFVIAAYSTTVTSGASGDYWIFQTDINGTLLNSVSYGGSMADIVRLIKPTPDNGFVVLGCSQSSNGDVSVHYGYYDGWLIKLNSSLGLEWETTLGGTLYEECYDVIIDNNGYYVVGHSESSNGVCFDNYGQTDIMVYFTDEYGTFWWSKNFGTSQDNMGSAILQKPNGNLIVGGYSRGADYDMSNNYGYYDMWLFEYTDISSVSQNENNENLIPVFPNPAQDEIRFMTDETNLQLSIYDSFGRKIMQQALIENRCSVTDFPNGIYFYELSNPEKNFYSTGKIVKQ